VLTEQEVAKSWRVLFKNGNINDESIARADALLDELRDESPLRHRLTVELGEIRRRHSQLVGK